MGYLPSMTTLITRPLQPLLSSKRLERKRHLLINEPRLSVEDKTGIRFGGHLQHRLEPARGPAFESLGARALVSKTRSKKLLIDRFTETFLA